MPDANACTARGNHVPSSAATARFPVTAIIREPSAKAKENADVDLNDNLYSNA